MSVISTVNCKLNIRSLMRCYSYKKDPGINARKKIINSNEELEDTDFDDLETDFMNLNKTYKEHATEVEARLEQTKSFIVRRKYFKEKHLNFLTFHDREQVKYLYNSDPEEWTIDKLSESFPLLPEDVKKVVKANWVMKPTRIDSHDRAVQKNWEDFQNGKLQHLPKRMMDHLSKFTNRTSSIKLPDTSQNKQVVIVNKAPPIRKEFSEIITSYEKIRTERKHKDLDKETTIDTQILDKNGKYNNAVKINGNIKKNVTLQQYRNTEENGYHSGKSLSGEEKSSLKNFKPSLMNSLSKHKESHLQDAENTNKSASVTNYNQNYVNHFINPEKIIIPKDQRKKDCIYKLHDCFYDDDGSFLYRVPGMY